MEGVPDPSQFAAKAKSAVKKATGSLPSNPAADFAAQAKKTGNKLTSGAVSNPARDFANAVRTLPHHRPDCFWRCLLLTWIVLALSLPLQVCCGSSSIVSCACCPTGSHCRIQPLPSPCLQLSVMDATAPRAKGVHAAQAKKAKAKVTNNPIQLPVVAAPSLYDYSTLQKDVGFFGFGKKAANKAGSVAEDVKANASSVADKASSVADKASDVADKVNLCTCMGSSDCTLVLASCNLHQPAL